MSWIGRNDVGRVVSVFTEQMVVERYSHVLREPPSPRMSKKYSPIDAQSDIARGDVERRSIDGDH